MERLLFVFAIIVFVGSLLFLIMNFIGDYDGLAVIISIFGLLNASIAIGVSDILGKLKDLK